MSFSCRARVERMSANSERSPFPPAGFSIVLNLIIDDIVVLTYVRGHARASTVHSSTVIT